MTKINGNNQWGKSMAMAMAKINGNNQWEWEKSMGSIKSRILTTQI
ncbi:MAG: hypothetical protein RI980_403 [Bacteroidota bacterium]